MLGDLAQRLDALAIGIAKRIGLDPVGQEPDQDVAQQVFAHRPPGQLILRRDHRQTELLLRRSGQEAADRMGLLFGHRNKLGQCCAVATTEQVEASLLLARRGRCRLVSCGGSRLGCSSLEVLRLLEVRLRRLGVGGGSAFRFQLGLQGRGVALIATLAPPEAPPVRRGTMSPASLGRGPVTTTAMLAVAAKSSRKMEAATTEAGFR